MYPASTTTTRTDTKGKQISTFHDHALKGDSMWKGVDIMYWKESRSWENLGREIENHADSVAASNGQRFGGVQLIQADKVGDKNGFLLYSKVEGQHCPISLIERVRTPPLTGKGWDRSKREALYWRWKVAMFSEWTASRAAGKRLEDVIRKQWAVPSTHNPPTWECVCVSVCVYVLNLMRSVTLHPLDYKKKMLFTPTYR